jgi:kumamolisin
MFAVPLQPCFTALAFAWLSGTPVGAAAAAGGRVRFADSIVEVPTAAPASNPRRVRETLTEAELAESVDFIVSLKMRDLDRLEALAQSKRIVSVPEMQTGFLPLKSDYDRVAAWLTAQGFAITLVDSSHTNIVARGSVAKIADALEVSFARVATDQGEFTSAVTAPSLPTALAPPVLGIVGLQPHIRGRAAKPQAAAVSAVDGFATPADLLAGYHAPGNLNGAGQSIAIIMDAIPLESDLSTFWQEAGIDRTPAKCAVVLVGGGPTAGSQSASQLEVSLDTEWSGSIAPGANIIVYAPSTIGLTGLLSACVQILNDGTAKIATCSGLAFAEGALSSAARQSASQVFVQMAAAGITLFYSSGDGGSNPASDGFTYNAGSALSATYPASDPYVTGVGGTTATFDSNWTMIGEAAWFGFYNGVLHGSSGGVSALYSRPAWQSGPGVPAGTMRCVPDVAAMSYANTATGKPAFIVLNGVNVSTFGGTSLSAPTWAAVTALIDQARNDAGLPPLGLLGPWVYPLIGTGAFNDITIGTNGAYNAGPGYDLCTGIGTPNVAALVEALTAVPAAITVQPSAQTVVNGTTVVFNVTARGSPAPTYQWSWNGSFIAGATDACLVLNGATAANAGSYTCLVTNTSGSVLSDAATLTVSSTKDSGRLINLSTLAVAGSGSQLLTVGFFTGGAGTTGSQSLLVQALGPAMSTLGVPGAMPDPWLNVLSNQTIIGSNAGWGMPLSNQLAVIAADVVTYATALSDPTSKDSAIVVPLAPGGYTVQVSSASGVTGRTLASLYDNTPPGAYTATTPRLINLSCRLQVDANSSLTAGFWIGGTTAKTVLVRADGPALLAQGVTGVMADPQLTVYNAAENVIAYNAGWGGSQALSSIARSVYAQPFTDPNSKDSEVLITLPPSGYTAQVSSASNTAGDVMIEVYEVP